MLIKRIAHICIGANDLKETDHFYCTVLGLERGFDFIKNDELYGFYVKAGHDTFIEIFTQEAAANYERPIIRHICLEVEDIDAFIARMQEHGIETTEKKFGGDNSWQTWITDPSGVSIELMQYTDESSQHTGNPCQVDW